MERVPVAHVNFLQLTVYLFDSTRGNHGEALDEGREERISQSLSVGQEKKEQSPSAPPTPAPPRVREMLSTPIDASLRQTLRKLRYEFKVAEAFTVETALREFFGVRRIEDVVADLQGRGGRLRRPR